MSMFCFMAIVVKEIKEINSLYSTNIKTQFSHIICTRQSYGFRTFAVIMGVQKGEMSTVGRLIK
jgi:hypothetical protein